MARGDNAPIVNEEPGVQSAEAGVTTEPAAPEKWVRVKNNETGHEVTKLASVVARAPKDRYSPVKKEAVDFAGKPLPAKPRRELGE